ncbi:tape measure protein [Devosia sp. 2618]|uniref:tape measure protein n=1 Tax=Devosia sp. 2618 TaxID=3156454 RepID=UPI0033981846
MATDIERLIVSLEASTSKYERALAKANGETDKRVRAMQSRFDGLGSGIARTESRLAGSLGNVGRAFGVLGIALTTTSIIAMTSAWTDLNSRVNNAAGGVERGAAVLDQLSVMARRTYSSLQQTAEGYLQNSQALTALGYSTQQQLDLVEALNNSLVISATRGQAVQSVMSAWSKAMAEGKLSGDNLNTIIQSGGRLSKALADSMGVSVNELRRLGSEGKITTDIMYGVTSQLATLREEAERMPATVSDGFVLLNNAVFKFIGQADEAIGSSNELATALIGIADAIDRAPDEPWFDRIFGDLGDEVASTVNATYRELVAIGTALDYIANTSPGKALDDIAAFGEGDSTKGIRDFELALGDAEQAVASLALNTKGSFETVIAETENGVVTLGDAVQDLFQQALEGKGSAEAAQAAIEALGSVGDPEFAALQGVISSVIANLYAMRDAANAANAAAANTTNDLGNFPSRRQFNKDFGPDLSNDGVPGGPIRPPSAGGGRGGGKSPSAKFQDDLDGYARKIEMLKQETALTAALNPLLNDYGFAKAQLTAQQELENAATKAGIELGPQQREKIAELAAGYATATAEAARLAETQGLLKMSADELSQASRQMLDTIIDGFLEGKDAGEIFNSMLKDLGKNLLNIGLNLIGGGMQTGGFNFMKLFGFAKGGIAANGRPQPLRQFAKGGVSRTAAIFGEAGPEAAVPLPDGRRIPVDLRMPAIPQARGGEQKMAVHIVLDNELLTAVVRDEAGRVVATAAPTIVGASVNQANKSAPSALARYQQQRGGGEYRT